MGKRIATSVLCIIMVLLFFSTGEAEEQCCCTITCSYETVFGGTKRKTVDQCFDIGIGSGKVANCKEDDACLSAIELGWLYLNEWEGSGCSLRDSDCLTAYLLGDGSPELDILRQFRDEVLSKTAAGREIIRLYYYAGPMLIQAMEKDEKLRDYMTKLLDTALLLLADGEMK